MPRWLNVMIIVSTQNTSDWSQAQVYRLSGEPVLFQTACAALKSFHVEEAPVEMVVGASMAAQEHLDRIPADEKPPLVYKGPAPFGERQRQVSYRRDGDYASIEFEDDLVCEIDFKHSHIHLIREGGFSNLVNVELVTGPAILIVLASIKKYCLHASAVLTQAGTAVIIGESGAGKSTLGWHAGDGWQQLSDDILPISYDKENRIVQLSTEFPQLKLEGSAAPGLGIGKAKVNFVLRLNPVPAKEIQFKTLTRAEAMLQFVRHTVASKLFDQTMLEHHNRFAEYVAKRVHFIELSYPRDLLALTNLREQIVEHLHSLNKAQR